MVNKNKIAGVYGTHAEAVKALQRLQEHQYPVEEKVVIVGHGEIVEDHLHLYPATHALKASAVFGAIIGGIAGVLVALGILMVPGVEIPLGAWPMRLLTGTSLGVIIGTGVGMVITLIIGEQGILRKKKHFEMDDYTLEIRGEADDVQKARYLLGTLDEFEMLVGAPA